MSKQAVELLEAFEKLARTTEPGSAERSRVSNSLAGRAGTVRALEALPPGDRQAFAVEVLLRTREFPFDSGPLPDGEIGEAGRSLFAFLDQEEDASAPR